MSDWTSRVVAPWRSVARSSLLSLLTGVAIAAGPGSTAGADELLTLLLRACVRDATAVRETLLELQERIKENDALRLELDAAIRTAEASAEESPSLLKAALARWRPELRTLLDSPAAASVALGRLRLASILCLRSCS